MAVRHGNGNFINNRFINDGSLLVSSFNPSESFEPVFCTKTDSIHVDLAIAAARNAYHDWNYTSKAERRHFLLALKESFIKYEQEMAHAIASEMGKILSEALNEAKSLSARIDLMLEHGLNRIKAEQFPALRAEMRYHNQGVLAVIGPYNFPAHLLNAHVIPSILTGNTVIVKPSEVCPWVGEIYAQCFLHAKLPKGVFNMIQGDGLIGHALCKSAHIDGVLFTGSYATGRALQELLLDQAHKILALEMGGKNIAVVMPDADLRQAALEIIQGAFLTTGQRCTATSRVLIHEKIYDKFANILVAITKDIIPGSAFSNSLFGPLATLKAQEKFLEALSRGRAEGAQVLLESKALANGAYVTPSIYALSAHHPSEGFLSEELFGPNICIEPFSSLDGAIKRINQSPFGLSNAIFTLDAHNAERLFHETRCGVLNINRSTNGALGNLPFGGVNQSGNQRAAGIDAVRYTTFPVAMTSLAYGNETACEELKKLANLVLPKDNNKDLVSLRHQIETSFELFGINSEDAAGDRVIFLKSSFDNLGDQAESFFCELQNLFEGVLEITKTQIIFNLSEIQRQNNIITSLESCLEKYSQKNGLALRKATPLAMNIPEDLHLPRSQKMLDRLYRDNFVPHDKKALVADLNKSRGAFLASIDDNPLVLFDAASQIATLGAGFMADTFQNAYECGAFDKSLLQNYDLSQEFGADPELSKDAQVAKDQFEEFLFQKSGGNFSSIAYGASGAEANEIAFDLCRQHGPGGTRILAFEGSFHGRTLMALQATYNKEKRGPFAFKGYEACFLPFPAMSDPHNQPEIPSGFLASLAAAEIPKYESSDLLFDKELESLARFKEEVLLGNICCVIVEPMQCEGGDLYASNRFFNGLRALSKALNIPLIFDEVQTGFNLGRTFFWHEQFDLKDHTGKINGPDCLTLGKKAQLGVCMSKWPNPRTYSPHVIQLKRGLLHARALDGNQALLMEQKAQKELARLKEYFPKLVSNGRACGFAFAFDMPSNVLAMELINQRFDRGFMVYIAGEKTLRFRLNMTTSDALINTLFEKLFIALIDLRDGNLTKKIPRNLVSNTSSPNQILVSNIKITKLDTTNFADYAQAIQKIEDKAYENGRRDTPDTLQDWLEQPDSLGLIMNCELNQEKIIGGYAIGGPLEHAKADGPQEDYFRMKSQVFYSANITLDERLRGFGLGRLLKEEQIRRVSALKNSEGSPRYYFISGRNHVGRAGSMTRINEDLKAYTIKIFDNQYGDPQARAAYYRLPLFKSHHALLDPVKTSILDCQNSIHTPLSEAPESLVQALKQGKMRTLACSKLTLSNWATPNLIRYSELLRTLMPRSLGHAYFTSGRDEIVDKGLRSLRFHRPDADIALGFSHQWLGNVSAAARSLSHAENQAQPFGFFDWPHIGHPAKVGPEQSLHELKSLISLYGPDRILGIVIELMGEKSGFYFEESFLEKLDEIRMQTKIPLVFVETTSAYGRSGRSLFLSDSLQIKANMVWWYSGGQLGQVFVDDQYFVAKPLTLISTWDGDDISIMRAYHNLLATSDSTYLKAARDFEKSLAHKSAHGLGCWQGVKVDNAAKIIESGKELGVLLSQGFEDILMICPKPDLGSKHFEVLAQNLNKLIDHA